MNLLQRSLQYMASRRWRKRAEQAEFELHRLRDSEREAQEEVARLRKLLQDLCDSTHVNFQD